MKAFLAKAQRAEAPVIPTTADFRVKVKEAALAVESALLAAETLASHGVVESLNYERMIDFLIEASKAVDGIDAGLLPGPTTVFPTRASAENFIALHPLDSDHMYQIHQDGVGRCTIAVFRIISHL
jgi:hypothetical protein